MADGTSEGDAGGGEGGGERGGCGHGASGAGLRGMGGGGSCADAGRRGVGELDVDVGVDVEGGGRRKTGEGRERGLGWCVQTLKGSTDAGARGKGSTERENRIGAAARIRHDPHAFCAIQDTNNTVRRRASAPTALD